MAWEKCITSFNEATGLDLTDDESKKLLQSMIAEKNRIVSSRGVADSDAMMLAAQRRADDLLGAVKQLQKNTLNDTLKRTSVIKDVEANGGIRKASDTLAALLRGSNFITTGAKDSIESRYYGKRNEWGNVMENNLYKAGLWEKFKSHAYDKDSAITMYDLSMGKKAGSGDGAEIGKILYNHLEVQLKHLNNSGANIKEAMGYVMKTLSSPENLRAAAGAAKTPAEAFEAWYKDTSPLLSDRTFGDYGNIASRKEKLNKIFNAEVTGVHGISEIEGGSPLPSEFQDTKNVANKVSASRYLIFKDGASWYEYMQKYGKRDNLYASMVDTIDRTARASALLQKLGTNPQANFNMIVRNIAEKYRDIDPDGVAKFMSASQKSLRELRYLDGTLDRPQNMRLEKFTSAATTVESMGYTGGLGLTHGASIWFTAPSELVHHGASTIEGLENAISGLAKGRGEGEYREILSQLGAYSDGIFRHQKGISGDDSFPGILSATASRFMDATGVHFIYDRTKAGTSSWLANNLASGLSKGFKDLEPHLQDMLQRYRITPEYWEVMRSAKDLPQENGRSYLTPAAASSSVDEAAIRKYLTDTKVIGNNAIEGKLNPEQVDKLHTQSIEDFRQELSDRLFSYYSDGARASVISPGVREKAALLQGTQRGTGVNTMLRFLTQFKQWPVAAYTQMMEREIFTSLSSKEAAWNIGKILALSVPAGYMKSAITNALTGREIPNPLDPKVLLESLAHSGGLSIWGDMLAGAIKQQGGGDFTSALAGPVVSDVNKAAKIIGEIGNQNKSDKSRQSTRDRGEREAIQLGASHIPFANLVYLRGAMNYMLWYHLYEGANPGWWDRTNQRLEKQKQQTYSGYKPGGSVPFGVPGVYFSNGTR